MDEAHPVGGGSSGRLRKVDFLGLLAVAEDWIHLLGDSDKGSSPT